MQIPIHGGFVDLSARRVCRDGAEVGLTSLEARLVEHLSARPGVIVPEASLLTAVWGQARPGDTRAVAHAVYRLRKKLERDPGAPRHLYTEHGCGYRWAALESPAAPEPSGPPSGARVPGPDPVPAPPPPTAAAPLGREAELDALAAAFAAGARGVQLLGGGGVGKTTLAHAHLARERAMGRSGLFVDASAARDAGDLHAALAGALGAWPGADLAELVRAALDADGGLLVVDNVEQVAAAAEALCGRLWAAAPNVRLLLTTRAELGLPDLRAHPIGPLPVPGLPDPEAPAMRLFLRTARRSVPGFAPDAVGLARVRRCVELVGGLPLGIEFAAARLRVLSLAELADRLSSSIVPLADGSPGRPARHRSLTATLDWSWALLTPEDRDAFAALSVFAGRFAASDAEAVLGPDGLDRLDALVSAGLVEPAGEEGARLLPPVRRYALVRLAERHELERRARRAHRARVADRAWAELDDPRAVARWRGDLDLAIDDALAEGDLMGAARCFHPLATDLTCRGPHARLASIVSSLWRHPEATPATRARLLVGPLEFAALVDLPADEITAAAASVPPGTVEADLVASTVHHLRLAAGRERVDLDALRALAERLRRAGEHRAATLSLHNIGAEIRRRGDFAAAADHLARAVAVAEDAGLDRQAALTRANLAAVLARLGRYEDAIEVGTRVRRWAVAAGDRRREALAVGNMGYATTRAGRVEEGLALFLEAEALGVAAGDALTIAGTQLNVGENLRRLGRLGEAVVALRRAREGFDRLATQRGRVTSRITLAQALLDLGDRPAAHAELTEIRALDAAVLHDAELAAMVAGLSGVAEGDLTGALRAAEACPDPEMALDLVVRVARDASAAGDAPALDAAARLRDFVVERSPDAASVLEGRWPAAAAASA